MYMYIHTHTHTHTHTKDGPRKISPGPLHSINTEMNTVARTRAKRKAGYFIVAHPV